MSIQYFKILGIEEGCSPAELKRAYRELAKRYHPDLNKSPGAQEQFIAVNEAYEFFLANGTGGKTIVRDGRSTSEMQDLFEQWLRRERARARRRAAEEARKRFEEFRNSPLYRTSNTLSIGADYFIIAVAGLMIIGPVFGVFYRAMNDGYFSANGIFAAVLLVIIGVIIIVFSAQDIRSRRKRR